MSAECHVCGHDLPYDGDCEFCSLRKNLAEAVEALEQLAEWGADRAKHSGASDMSREEERGWNLALSGLEYRCRTALQSIRGGQPNVD